MGSQGRHVYTDQVSIDKLESLVEQLPANGQVVLMMKDGSCCDGVVSTSPSVQVFRGAADQEGVHARVLRLRPDVPEWRRDVWLDQVVRVEHLDSMMTSES